MPIGRTGYAGRGGLGGASKSAVSQAQRMLVEGKARQRSAVVQMLRDPTAVLGETLGSAAFSRQLLRWRAWSTGHCAPALGQVPTATGPQGRNAATPVSLLIHLSLACSLEVRQANMLSVPRGGMGMSPRAWTGFPWRHDC